MNRIQANWKNQTAKEKSRIIAVLLLGLIVVVSAILGLTGALEPKIANLCLIPAMGILTLINGLAQREKNPKVGTILLVCAGIILVCAAVILAITLINP